MRTEERMKMGAATWLKIHRVSVLLSLLTFVNVFLSSLPWAASDSACAPAPAPAMAQGFLGCLLELEQPSYPISGAIYTPQNSSFSSVLDLYLLNKRFSTNTTIKPLVIVTALHESHVQATVLCARAYMLEFRTRSGGHDYDGQSYTAGSPFVLLDMFNLRSITFDDDNATAWVEAGANLGELYYGIANRSKTLAFPAGVCATVGVGGHFSGGGYGNLMRKYGLAADNVIDARLVDVNGKILDRAAMGEDLFWAIRGGGGASFGVIIEWRVKLVPVPEVVTYFHVGRTLEEGAADIFYKWTRIADKLPAELYIRTASQVVKVDDHKTVNVTFVGLFLGTANHLLPLMQQRFPELGLEAKDCKETSWIESTLLSIDQSGKPASILMNRKPSRPIYFKGKADYVRESIPKEGLEKIWKKMIELEKVTVNWYPHGGRMSEIPESATPFPHRAGVKFLIQYMALWLEEEKELSEQNKGLTRSFYEFMTPYVTKSRESYLNYRDLEIGNTTRFTSYSAAKVYGKKYFRNNFEALVKVKTRVDPANFFRNQQSIPPLLWLP